MGWNLGLLSKLKSLLFVAMNIPGPELLNNRQRTEVILNVITGVAESVVSSMNITLCSSSIQKIKEETWNFLPT